MPDCDCVTVTVTGTNFDGSAAARAVMVAVPGVTPRTNPSSDTVATALDDVCHVIAELELPVTVAVNCCTCPDVSVRLPGATEMLTGTVGEMDITDSV